MVADISTGGALWDRLFLPLVAAGAGSVTTLSAGRWLRRGAAARGSTARRRSIDLLLGSIIACARSGVRPGRGLSLPARAPRYSTRCGIRCSCSPLGGVVLGLLGTLGGPITLFKGLEQSEQLLSRHRRQHTGRARADLVVKTRRARGRGVRGLPRRADLPRRLPRGRRRACWAALCFPGISPVLAVACGVLGVVLAIARDGWIALFVARRDRRRRHGSADAVHHRPSDLARRHRGPAHADHPGGSGSRARPRALTGSASGSATADRSPESQRSRRAAGSPSSTSARTKQRQRDRQDARRAGR